MNHSVTIALLTALMGLSQPVSAQPGFVAGGIPLDRPDPVKGAPYSADAITEIHMNAVNPPAVIKTMAHLYRDSEGRERKEEAFDPETGKPLDPNRPPTITIFDPVEGVNYVLSPLEHTATKYPLPSSRGPSRMIQPTIQFTPTPGGAGTGAQIPQVTINQGDHVEVTGPPAMRAPTPTAPEHLEPTTIEGVHAEGTRTTQGEVVLESWTSTDLKIPVLTRRVDPHGIENTYRLTHISRDEPDAKLFQIPEEYKIQEMPVITGGMVTGGVSIGPPSRQ